MNKALLIARHEFLVLIRRKSFIILTLLFPLIGAAAIGIFQLAQMMGATEADEPALIGYVDDFGGFDGFTEQPGVIAFRRYDSSQEATDALLADDIGEYFVINQDYLDTGVITRYTLEKELEISGTTQWAMRVFLQSNLLEGQTSAEIAERVKSPMFLRTTRLDEAGQEAVDQGGIGALLVPVAFGFLLVMAIGMTSGYLLQGLGDEKESRVMEVLLSSVSTTQLLAGKVLGLGAAGLIQIVAWLGAIALLLRLSANVIGGEFLEIQMPDNVLLLGIVYFVLGYLLFAVLQAGVGAIAATAREGQQMTVIFVLPAILPFYVFILFLRDNPGHVVATLLTMVPVTAPMTVFLRLGMSDIPLWELLVSIGLMVAAIAGGIWVAARAFRVFLLMYGKTPRVGEIVRYLREG